MSLLNDALRDLEKREGADGSNGESVPAGLGAASYPRLINILAHKALIAAYGRGEREVTSRHVRQAIRDTDTVVRRPGVLGGLL